MEAERAFRFASSFRHIPWRSSSMVLHALRIIRTRRSRVSILCSLRLFGSVRSLESRIFDSCGCACLFAVFGSYSDARTGRLGKFGLIDFSMGYLKIRPTNIEPQISQIIARKRQNSVREPQISQILATRLRLRFPLLRHVARVRSVGLRCRLYGRIPPVLWGGVGGVRKLAAGACEGRRLSSNLFNI